MSASLQVMLRSLLCSFQLLPASNWMLLLGIDDDDDKHEAWLIDF